MEKLLKIPIILFLVFFFTAGSAMANLFDSEWEMFTENPVGSSGISISDALDTGPSYYIWTDDLARRSWNIYWYGDGNLTPGYNFSGVIALSANEFDVTSILFEAHNPLQDHAVVNLAGGNTGYILPGENITIEGAISLTYGTYAYTKYDGFHLDILGDEFPSFIGFDLQISGIDGFVKDSIFIGPEMFNPESQDFKIAAPVPTPEPATMMLLGTGLIGIAAFGRKKLKKKS